jgi:hypothetical protein
MSRPTPETDAFAASEFVDKIDELTQLYDLSEKLERERDEARDAFVIATDQMVIAQSNLREANKERDEARGDRDTIQTELEMWRDGNILHEVHRNELEKVEQERDEAREDLEFRRDLYKVQGEYLETACRERDEARDAIVGWENKWKCAVDMAARAELERDELKYSLKIRAINESLRYSKDRNESDNIISKLNFKL